MSIPHTPKEALEILVRDLNSTTWSSWQSTSKFSIALNVAEQVLERERISSSAHELLAALEKIAATDHDEKFSALDMKSIAKDAIAKVKGGSS